MDIMQIPLNSYKLLQEACLLHISQSKKDGEAYNAPPSIQLHIKDMPYPAFKIIFTKGRQVVKEVSKTTTNQL